MRNGSLLPLAAIVTNGGNGPFVTVMAEGRGLIAAPSTFRREGREAVDRCTCHQRQQCPAVSTDRRNTLLSAGIGLRRAGWPRSFPG